MCILLRIIILFCTMFSHLYIESTRQSNPFNISLWKYFISQILLQPPNLGKFLKKNPIINSMQIYNCSSSSIFVDSLVRAGQNIINPTIHVLYIVGIIVSCKRKLILHASIETGYDNIYIKAT